MHGDASVDPCIESVSSEVEKNAEATLQRFRNGMDN